MMAATPQPVDVEVQGDFLAHEVHLHAPGPHDRGGFKRWFGWSDTCGVDVAEGENDLLILAATVVIDMTTEKRDD